MDSLPIDDVLPDIRRALAATSALALQAPPGAGKTTRVPLVLLQEPWAAGGKIIMLEPRRLAARAAARRMSAMLNEPLGGTVGYRVRGETVVGARTRIEVVTEGVLIRMLIDDPTLDGVAAVILDEFHERSIQADTALALVMQTQAVVRSDLRIVVMSATLDAAPVAAMIGGVVVTSVGRLFPVTVHHVPPRTEMRIEAAVSLAVQQALRENEGDILVFLPGAPEIHRCISILDGKLQERVALLPLFGALSFAAQDEVMRAAPSGHRKVILATSIAESSLTIEGIRAVVDSGLSRVPRFNARSGMSQLATVRVTRASADQRCGRAGRTASGSCYRLWSEGEDVQLLTRARPEILEADLAPLVLTLAAAGVSRVNDLLWMDLPPAGSLAQACELLVQLGALEGGARDETAIPRITEQGREMAALPTHPRLAHMLNASSGIQEKATACAIAALLSERDVLRRQEHPDSDLRTRVAIVAGQERGDTDRNALLRVQDERRRLQDHFGIPRGAPIDVQATGRVLCRAYPDRIARRRAGSVDRYLLRNGSGASLRDAAVMGSPDFLVIADADMRHAHATIYLAAPVDETDVHAAAGDSIEREEVVSWDARAGAVLATKRTRLGAIILEESAGPVNDHERAAEELHSAILRGDGVSLNWSDAALELRERMAFVHSLRPDWPDVAETALLSAGATWLRPHLIGLRRRSEVERLPLAELLGGMLSWGQRRELDVLVPSHWTAPTGTRVRIEYGADGPPRVSIRLQEVFGVATSPMIGGSVPLTFILLSPAGRPIQVTRDLAGFWAGSYAEVRKEMRGRYPKHVWPDDPAHATPTRRAKPRA